MRSMKLGGGFSSGRKDDKCEIGWGSGFHHESVWAFLEGKMISVKLGGGFII